MKLPAFTDRNCRLLLLLAVLLGGLFHVGKLTLPVQGIHAMRQSMTMLNVRGFVHVDNTIFNPRTASLAGEKGGPKEPRIVRLEFPLYQWVTAQAQRAFGERLIVARLVMYLMAAAGFFGLYALLRAAAFEPIVALTTTLLFQFSALIYYYSINPFSDVLALSFGLWYLAFTMRYAARPTMASLIGAAVCLALATLCKLPFLMLSVAGIACFARLLFREKNYVRATVFAGVQLPALLPAFAWYAWVMPGWEGDAITSGVFAGGMTAADFWSYLWYNFSYVFPEQLLSWATLPFLFAGLYTLTRSGDERNVYTWSLLGVSFLYFFLQINNIERVHDYYLLPLMPGLYLVLATGLAFLLRRFPKRGPWVAGTLVAIAVVSGVSTASPKWDLRFTYFDHDVIQYQEALAAAVPDDEPVAMLNDPTVGMFAYAIRKNGYIYWGDGLKVIWLKDQIAHYNVRYLYSNSRAYDERPEVRALIDSTVLVAGSVRVHRLVAGE